MNALELADEIRNFYSNPNQPYFLTQIQTMLRTIPKLEAEIEMQRSLKNDAHEYHDACMKEALNLLQSETDEYRFKWVALEICNAMKKIEDLKEDNLKYKEWAKCCEKKADEFHAENEALIKEAALQRLSDFTQESENEHYCLVWEDAYGKLKVVDVCPPPEGSIKLYTHPVKELLDEEIGQIYETMGCRYLEDINIFDFARAILKKAREK